MKAICKRLKRGADLYKSIIKIAEEQDLSAGVIVSLVGCISEVRMRLAGGQGFMYNKDHYEIVSANGTISCTSQSPHAHDTFLYRIKSDAYLADILKKEPSLILPARLLFCRLKAYHF